MTIGLAAVGGLGLAAVVAHGAWTTHRAGPKRPTTAAPVVEPREPTLDGPASSESYSAMPAEASPLADAMATSGDDAPYGSGATASAAEAIGDAALAPVPARRLGPRIDPGIDALAVLALDTPLSGDLVLAHLPATRRAGTKAVLVEGLDVDTHQFEPPRAGRRYSELQAAVQLANRTGPLNEIEYSEFVQQLQTFADSVNATVDLPDMLEVIARARELDAMAGECDAQLAVHLRARGAAWSVAYVQQQAGRHGFVHGVVPGRLVVPSATDGAPPVLTLAFDAHSVLTDGAEAAGIREVVLHFDVPQTDAQSAPFATWQSTAEALARDMDAVLVDDAGQPLVGASFALIGQELEALYARLASQGVPAGSVAARRLFA